ncbi:hypothetical protein PQR34_44000 [Paraburkholderia sediminicola]|uniref:hypothetical protein n=1 Tax=Paraburkholderia sediminicola TaxID=458836 RepID=UPI0038BDCC22
MNRNSTFTDEQRDALALLTGSFRNWHAVDIGQVRVADPGTVAAGLFAAVHVVIPDVPLRIELGRETFAVKIADGRASEQPVVQQAYDDDDAMRRWSHAVIRWTADLVAHLQEQAAVSTVLH